MMNSDYSICIPTKNRPEILKRILHNLNGQTLLPKEVLIIEASDEDLRLSIEKNDFENLNINVIFPLRSGLTYQRVIGIDSCNTEYILMLDDDVLLEDDCASHMVNFLDQNPTVAATGAVIVNDYGKKHYLTTRIMNMLGFYDSFEPGTYERCGEFIQLNFRSPDFSDFRSSDFLPAGASMFRLGVIKDIRPDPEYRFGGEDKHWTLRIREKHTIGVLGKARLFHEHFSGGVRKNPCVQGKITQENMYIIYKEIGEKLKSGSSFNFFLYFYIKYSLELVFSIMRMDSHALKIVIWKFKGLNNSLILGYNGLKQTIKTKSQY